MGDYRLTVSRHVDAPRLARVFTRGVVDGLELSEDAVTAIVLMVSDAASDSVRAGHSVSVTGTSTEAGYVLSIEGGDLAPPTVTSMPDGIDVHGDDRVLEIRIGSA